MSPRFAVVAAVVGCIVLHAFVKAGSLSEPGLPDLVLASVEEEAVLVPPVAVEATNDSETPFESLHTDEPRRRLLETSSLSFDHAVAVPLRNRPNLPSGRSTLLPEFIHPPAASAGFPLVFTPSEDQGTSIASDSPVAAYAREIRRLVHDEGVLLRHGAVLLRGLPVRTVEEQTAFVEGLGWSPRKLGGGGTARSDLSKNVRTASDEPATHNIEPHMDMAHNPEFPRRIAFFMLEGAPVGRGGETVLVDMRNVTRDLHAAGVIGEFAAHGGDVLYKKMLWSADEAEHSFTWQRRYFTHNRTHVEAKLAALEGVTWRWNNATLEYANSMPSMHAHPETGERLWFNGAHTNNRDYFDLAPHIDTGRGSPFDTAFGDGLPIPQETLAKIRQAVWENSVAIPLQSGDVVIVDNMLVAHGRLSWDPEVARIMTLCHFD